MRELREKAGTRRLSREAERAALRTDVATMLRYIESHISAPFPAAEAVIRAASEKVYFQYVLEIRKSRIY